MKRNSQYVAAFTILELVIAMLVSAIVIAITYTAYSIMSKSYTEFSKKNEEMAVLIHVDELFKKDMERSKIVTAANQKLFFRDTSGIVTYEFAPDYLVRRGLAVDTFKVKVGALTAAFENTEINTNEIMETDTPVVDEIAFKLGFRNDTIPCHYHKAYSSQTLIKATTHAIN